MSTALVVEEQNVLIVDLRKLMQAAIDAAKKRERELVEERNVLTADLRGHIDALATRNAALERALAGAQGSCFELCVSDWIVCTSAPASDFLHSFFTAEQGFIVHDLDASESVREIRK